MTILKIRLRTAVMSMNSPSISYSMKILLNASTTSHSVRTSRKVIETIVPIISLLCQPNVYWSDFSLRVKYSDVIDMRKPSKSDPRCAQSAASAIEPARYAPIP